MRKKLLAVIAVGLILVGVGAFYFQLQNRNRSGYDFLSGESGESGVEWRFENEWKAIGTPPECVEPLRFSSPVEVELVSGILYPGQIRGNDYKAHGGFRFDERNDNEIEVRAIMDGYVLKASRYEVGGEIQNMVFYVNECGLMIMHDHLLTLSPRMQAMFDELSVGKNGDSRTTEIRPRVLIAKGEVLATEVGFKKNKNIFLDFGLYDLRKTNGVKYTQRLKESYFSINEYGAHALCWLDYLEVRDRDLVKRLPAGGIEGKTSDYCDN